MSVRNPLARRLCFLAAVSFGLMFSSTTCRATTFSWPTTPAFTAGAPAIGASSTVDYFPSGGGAVSVTLTNTGAAWNTGFPQVAAAGGGFVNGGTTNNGLILQPISESTTATYVQVTINFMYTGGANNISFQLWDVDATSVGAANGYIDTITNIQGTAFVGGGTVFATTLNNTHTSNPGTVYNIITGTGATAVVTGQIPAANGTDQGTVNIGFSQTVTSVSFRYLNTAATSRTQQTLGVGPITFTGIGTAFPEVNSSGAALMLCGGVLGFGLVRRRRSADRSPCESYA